jgi:hypothetical protein
MSWVPVAKWALREIGDQVQKKRNKGINNMEKEKES